MGFDHMITNFIPEISYELCNLHKPETYLVLVFSSRIVQQLKFIKNQFHQKINFS